MEIKEKIIEYISKDDYKKESIDELSLSLSIPTEDFKNFVKAINELEDEGIIYITNKGYIHNASKVNIYVGTIKSLKKYYGLCELKDGSVVTIYNEDLKNAYVNDIVRIHLNKNDTAEVMDVISHSLWQLVATYKNHDFIVDEKNFPFEIKVKKEKEKFHLVEGNIVLLKVKKYEGMLLLCEIKEILGHVSDPGIDILSLIIKSNVKYKFDNELLSFTNKIVDLKTKDISNELKNRKDYSNDLIVTIDGLDAKDLDDAISLKINENGNYVLGVHIADVSNYVTKNSLLDKEAFTRGTSIYLADRVIPMLPHILCNGLCSLNPNEIRLTMSCEMEIDGEGNVINYEINPSYIISKYRLDYDDVNALFENIPTRLTYNKELKEMLFLMLRLSKILSKKMVENGYIELNIEEAKIIIDENTNKVIDIKKRESKDAEKLIENFMILANETVASHIYYMQLPFIYRVHPQISNEKLSFMIEKLKELNVNINSKANSISVKKIQEILNKLKGTDYEFVANNIILRSMSKAYYSTNNIGHFGLGSKCYTHFTSPIRRYPDLIVHRFLKKYLVENDFSDEMEYLIQCADNSSITERNAISLERDVEDMKKAEYMSNFIGCIYDGIVTSVMDFGIFVQLDNTCEGLMRYDTMEGAYYYNLSYFAKQFRIGQKILVKVLSTNTKNGEINFAYVKKNNYNKNSNKKKGKNNEKTYKHK